MAPTFDQKPIYYNKLEIEAYAKEALGKVSIPYVAIL